MVIALVLVALLCTVVLLPPVFREARRAKLRLAVDQFRDFQAFAVRKYHPAFQSDPELRDLSSEDLRRDYNLSVLYEQLGRGR